MSNDVPDNLDLVEFLGEGKTEAQIRNAKLMKDERTGKFIFPRKYLKLLIQYRAVNVIPGYKDDKGKYHPKIYKKSLTPDENPLEDEPEIIKEEEDVDEDDVVYEGTNVDAFKYVPEEANMSNKIEHKDISALYPTQIKATITDPNWKEPKKEDLAVEIEKNIIVPSETTKVQLEKPIIPEPKNLNNEPANDFVNVEHEKIVNNVIHKIESEGGLITKGNGEFKVEFVDTEKDLNEGDKLQKQIDELHEYVKDTSDKRIESVKLPSTPIENNANNSSNLLKLANTDPQNIYSAIGDNKAIKIIEKAQDIVASKKEEETKIEEPKEEEKKEKKGLFGGLFKRNK